MSNIKYYKKITANNSLFDLKLKEIWRYRELIGVLTKRSFQVRYRQTILGPFWLFIGPIISTLITYLVFGKIANIGTNGIPPILFYLSSNALWAFFSSSVTKNANVFRTNAYLFSKVYFPRLCMSISYVLSDLIDFGIRMLLVVVFMIYYCFIGQLKINIASSLLLPLILFIIGVLAMSFGILISSLTTKYRDFSVLLTYVMPLWMFITPVAYPISEISNPVLLKIFLLNPMTGLMELFRFSLFGKGEILVGNLIYSCIFIVALLISSVVIFNKVERRFTDTI